MAVGVPLLCFSTNYRSGNICEHDIQCLLSKQKTKSNVFFKPRYDNDKFSCAGLTSQRLILCLFHNILFHFFLWE